MKKIIVFTAALIVVFAFVSATSSNIFTKQKPVSKEINLAISSHNNYSSAAYNDAKASVHIIITKVNGTKKTVVSDNLYNDMQLNQIPINGNEISRKVIIPNVFNDKEKLVITYTISYDSRGSIIQFCNEQTASENNKEKIEINI